MTSKPRADERRLAPDVPDPQEPEPIEKDSPDSDEHNARMRGAIVPPGQRTTRNILPRVIE